MTSHEEERNSYDPSGLWRDQWWWKPQWRKQINLSDQKLRNRIAVLEQEFDAHWAHSLRDRLGEHPLAQNILFCEGLAQAYSLLRLADDIQRLSNVNGFPRVLKAYKQLETARSADLELFMGGALSRLGLNVEFIVPKPDKGKTPDLLVRTSTGEFVVECKYLNDAKAENWVKDYTKYYWELVRDAVPNGVALFFKHRDEFIDVRRYGYPDLTPYQLAASIDAQSVLAAIREILSGGKRWGYRVVEPAGDILVLPESDVLRTCVVLPSLHPKALLKRLLGNGLTKANDQIRAFGIPGIAVVFYSEAAELGSIKREFEALIHEDPQKFEWLTALLVFPKQNILRYVRPYLIENPHSCYSLEALGVAVGLTQMFEPL